MSSAIAYVDLPSRRCLDAVRCFSQMELRRQQTDVAADLRSGLRKSPLWVSGAAIGVIALTPPILMPALAPSVYIFGLAAVVASALLSPISSVITLLVAALAGPILDHAGGASGFIFYLHFTLFLTIAGGVVFLANRSAAVQRRLAEVLERDERREAVLNSILATCADALLVIDSKGIVSSFSTSAESLFGWKKSDIVGRNVNVLMPAPYQAEHDGYIDRFLQTGDRRIIGKNRTVTGLRKDGTPFPMALYVGEIHLGKERHFTGFAHDLTALNEAEGRVLELRSQLTSVWRMNSLGEMAAMLAHELNQPLSAISNYMRGARSIAHRLELKEDDLLHALDMAAAQAVRAGEIIRRTRAAAAREDVEYKPESLLDLISEAELMLETMAREGQVSLRFDLAREACFAKVDRIQVQQVIGNLVRNAIEAMKDSREKILEISMRLHGDDWIIRIEDSGPGVPLDIADRLFEPMTTTKTGGMGLGLSISRKIIERHGGAIWCDNSRLGGAAFCFSLQNEPHS